MKVIIVLPAAMYVGSRHPVVSPADPDAAAPSSRRTGVSPGGAMLLARRPAAPAAPHGLGFRSCRRFDRGSWPGHLFPEGEHVTTLTLSTLAVVLYGILGKRGYGTALAL